MMPPIERSAVVAIVRTVGLAIAALEARCGGLYLPQCRNAAASSEVLEVVFAVSRAVTALLNRRTQSLRGTCCPPQVWCALWLYSSSSCRHNGSFGGAVVLVAMKRLVRGS